MTRPASRGSDLAAMSAHDARHVKESVARTFEICILTVVPERRVFCACCFPVGGLNERPAQLRLMYARCWKADGTVKLNDRRQAEGVCEWLKDWTENNSTTGMMMRREEFKMGDSAYVERIRSFASAVIMGMALLESHESNLGGISHQQDECRVLEVVSQVDRSGKAVLARPIVFLQV